MKSEKPNTRVAWQKAPPLTVSPWDPAPMRPTQLRSSHDVWAAAKQIDGLGGESTYYLFTHRAVNFHSPTVWHYEPLSSFNDAANSVMLADKARQSGVAGNETGGVAVAFHYWSSMLNASDGRLSNPSIADRYMGRHAVRLVAVEDDDTLSFVTGWSGWAKGDGIGYITRNYFDSHVTECMLSRPWNRGPMAQTYESLYLDTDASSVRRDWRAWRPSGAERITGEPARSWHETWSESAECPVEVLIICIKDFAGSDIRVATAIVHFDHLSSFEPEALAGPATSLPYSWARSCITDLFVWPPYRRQGFGTLMVGFAEDRASARGATGLEISIWDADCVSGESVALSFVGALGFNVVHQPGAQERHHGSKTILKRY